MEVLALEALREFLAPWGGVSDAYVVDNNTTVEEPVRRGERKILLIQFHERIDDMLLSLCVQRLRGLRQDSLQQQRTPWGGGRPASFYYCTRISRLPSRHNR